MSGDLRNYLSGEKLTARRPGPVARYFRTKRGRWTLGAIAGLVIACIMFLIWFKPWQGRPYLLTFDALVDGGKVIIDETPYRPPIYDMEVEPGRLHVSYAYNCWPIELDFTIDAARHYNRLNLLVVSKDPKHAPQDPMDTFLGDGSMGTLLRFATGHGNHQLFVNGKPAPKPGYFWVRPGEHLLEARSESGAYESQRVLCRKHLRTEVTLLPRVNVTPLTNAPVPGSFRRTLTTVLSPLPSDMTLELDDGVVKFMNQTPDTSQELEFHINTCITPVVAKKDLHVTLRVEFPEPMQSVVAFWSAHYTPVFGTIQIFYRVDGGEWIAQVPKLDENGEILHFASPLQVRVPKRGARSFELKGILRSNTGKAFDTTPLEFLQAYLGPGSNTHSGVSAAFAIVADPNPYVSRLRESDG